MAFGVKTANIYDLLGDDNENVEPVETELKPSAAAKEKTVTKPVTTVAAGVEARLRGSANGPASGRGRGEGRSGRGGRGGRGSDRPARDDAEGGETVEGDRRSRTGRGRGRGADRGRRRDHDRHDGTGRGHETEKRDGAGSHNWGNVLEEEKADEEAVEEKTAEPEENVVETPAAEEQPTEEAEPAEPEKEEMTLDQYLKVMEEKRASLKKKPVSEAKADPKAFEGMKAYSRPEDENELELTNKKSISGRKSGLVEKARKEKEVVPTGFRVGSDEFGRGRGGRGRGVDRGSRREDAPDRDDRPPRRNDAEFGGFRGGRGGGFRGRGDRPSSGRGRGRDGPAPAIDDASAFPTLGGGK